MKKLRNKNSLLARIVDAVKRGEKLTYSEMAKEFDVTKSRIGSTLVTLRKKGYFFFSIGAIRDPRGIKSKEGIIVDIKEKGNYYKQARKEQRTQLDTRLENTFGMIEAALFNFPELTEEVREDVENLYMKVLMGKKGIAKMQIGKAEEPKEKLFFKKK